MNKKILIIVMLLITTLSAFSTELPTPVKKEKEPVLTLWIIGDMLMPGDAVYKDLFGSSQFCPKFKITANILQSFYLFGAVSFLNKTATFQEYNLNIEVKNTQLLGTFGAGYQFSISKGLNAYLEAGGLYASLKEEAMGISKSGNGIGFSAEGGITFKLSGPLKIGIHAGYAQATIDFTTDEGLTLTAKPGGLSFGVGFGLSI